MYHFWKDSSKQYGLSPLICNEKIFLISSYFLLYRYPSYYPSYGPTTGSTSFYTTDLTPFSTNRSNAEFPKAVRSDPGIAKDIKQEQDVKEHGSFFLTCLFKLIFKKRYSERRRDGCTQNFPEKSNVLTSYLMKNMECTYLLHFDFCNSIKQVFKLS